MRKVSGAARNGPGAFSPMIGAMANHRVFTPVPQGVDRCVPGRFGHPPRYRSFQRNLWHPDRILVMPSEKRIYYMALRVRTSNLAPNLPARGVT